MTTVLAQFSDHPVYNFNGLEALAASDHATRSNSTGSQSDEQIVLSVVGRWNSRRKSFARLGITDLKRKSHRAHAFDPLNKRRVTEHDPCNGLIQCPICRKIIEGNWLV